MSETILVCSSCGSKFKWTRDEQVQAVKDMPLDDVGFGDKPSFLKPPTECPSCRPKQDQQRS